jgi:mono/diheme cytochrome c family protein
MRHWLLPALLTLSACSEKASEPAASDQASPPAAAQSLFQADIAPLLASSCAICHLTGQEAGNMSLIPGKAIAALVGVKATGAPALTRVVPGEPDKSYLVMKLEGTQVAHGGTGAQMPFGAPPLAPEKIAAIREWIKQGARP